LSTRFATTQTIALGVEYDGSQFHGWQRQARQCSVQQYLEEALSSIAAAPIRVVAAGRTDTGVHATGQVASFRCDVKRNIGAWVAGSNSLTPQGISVTWAKQVDGDFHARFRATARQYIYVIRESVVAPAIARHYLLHSRQPLDHAAMHKGAQHLVGEHDFSAFRAAGCQAASAIRNLHSITVRRFHNTIVLSVSANAFLQHMVRNLVGSLLIVGRGEKSADWIAELLHLKNRQLAGMTAAAEGLYLHRVFYADRYDFPVPALPAILSTQDEIC